MAILALLVDADKRNGLCLDCAEVFGVFRLTTTPTLDVLPHNILPHS